MPSVTTAQSRACIAINMAMVKAGWISSFTVDQSAVGICHAGSCRENSPNWDPIVAMCHCSCRPNPATTAVATTSPTMAPGT